ncbi:MAG: glycosyltransferase [Fibrobacterota bacterium]
MAKLKKPLLPGNVPSEFPPKTLSVCMIVKNEEAVLPECLEGAKAFADEIVIVDTGSTDRTVEIARSYGAKVIHSVWKDDFSFSRNLSLDNAACSWIVWLDADDRVDAASAANINRLKNEVEVLQVAFGFKVQNVKPNSLGDIFVQLRMFPNDRRLRFERRIHEQIAFALMRNHYRVQNVDGILVRHTGYHDEALKKKKALRNRAILEADLKNYPEDPNYLSAYGDTFFMADEWEKGIEIYKQVYAIPDCRKKQQEIYAFMPVAIALGYQNLKQYDAALAWIEKDLKEFPDRLDVLFMGGEVAYDKEAWDDALSYYGRVVVAPDVFASTPVDNEGFRTKSLIRTGHIHRKRKNYDEAIRIYRGVLEKHSFFHDLPGTLGETLLEAGRLAEAMKAFSDSVLNFPGKDARAYLQLAAICAQVGRVDDAIGFYDKGLSFFPESLEMMEGLKLLYRERNMMDRYLEVSERIRAHKARGAVS